MSRARGLAVAVAGLVLLAGCTSGGTLQRGGSSAGSRSATPSPSPTGPRVPTTMQPVKDGELMSYVVNTSTGSTSKADSAITKAGGTVIADWPQIGVVVAQSSEAAFRKNLLTQTGADVVQSVGATRTTAVKKTVYGKPDVSPDRPAPADTTTPDPQESQQWDMRQLGTSASDEGSASVRVGVLDGGVDQYHPDLRANFDAQDSASCIDGGRLDRDPQHWLPTNSGHGTHVAGTIAAARNGVGIAGVAPEVRIASVKVVDDAGLIYPEYAICGFVWAGLRHLDVTNNSYYIDPWTFWCSDGADQQAAKEAVSRAVAYSEKQGVISAAAAGNSDYDLADKKTDTDSPDDSPTTTRTVNAKCLNLPAELPGVVTVASTEQDGTKSSFSNYGLGIIDVAAPGGQILSTWPGGGYQVLSGTSMASPHVAGVLALLKSRHRDADPGQLLRMVREQAVHKPCPSAAPQCTGTTADNSYFGDGLVTAKVR